MSVGEARCDTVRMPVSPNALLPHTYRSPSWGQSVCVTRAWRRTVETAKLVQAEAAMWAMAVPRRPWMRRGVDRATKSPWPSWPYLQRLRGRAGW